MKIRGMHCACWITKATNTQSEYAILIGFPKATVANANASQCHVHTYIVHLVKYWGTSNSFTIQVVRRFPGQYVAPIRWYPPNYTASYETNILTMSKHSLCTALSKVSISVFSLTTSRKRTSNTVPYCAIQHYFSNYTEPGCRWTICRGSHACAMRVVIIVMQVDTTWEAHHSVYRRCGTAIWGGRLLIRRANSWLRNEVRLAILTWQNIETSYRPISDYFVTLHQLLALTFHCYYT
jgi:hypothetical protein